MEQQPQQASSSATTTSSSSPSSSQRRELQGPRPAPLKLRKDSHKIRKPPPGGGPVQLQQQVRQPVIIYTLSPKVVHAEPGEFMSVVQRLTGATAATASSSSSSLPAPPPPGLTTTEPHHHQIQMTTSSSLPFPFPFLGGHQQQYVHAPPPPPPSSAQLLPPAAPQLPFQLQQLSPVADVVGGGLLPPFPSILSPGSLPAIPPSFFSPPGISLFGGLISPAAFLGNETSTGGGSNSMMSIAAMAGATHHQSVMSSSSLQEASPSTTVTPSPSAGATYHWDPFNNQH